MQPTEEHKPPSVGPSVDIEIRLPGISNSSGADISGESLSIATSLVARAEIDCEPDVVVADVVDILGSAVAESTGWRPPEHDGR